MSNRELKLSILPHPKTSSKSSKFKDRSARQGAHPRDPAAPTSDHPSADVSGYDATGYNEDQNTSGTPVGFGQIPQLSGGSGNRFTSSTGYGNESAVITTTQTVPTDPFRGCHTWGAADYPCSSATVPLLRVLSSRGNQSKWSTRCPNGACGESRIWHLHFDPNHSPLGGNRECLDGRNRVFEHGTRDKVWLDIHETLPKPASLFPWGRHSTG